MSKRDKLIITKGNVKLVFGKEEIGLQEIFCAVAMKISKDRILLDRSFKNPWKSRRLKKQIEFDIKVLEALSRAYSIIKD